MFLGQAPSRLSGCIEASQNRERREVEGQFLETLKVREGEGPNHRNNTSMAAFIISKRFLICTTLLVE